MVRGLRCPLTYLLLQFADIHRYIPPCWHSVSLRQKTLQAPALRPCTELSSAPWVRRDPHRLLRPDAPLHSRGFTPYLALCPQLRLGRFPFRVLFTLGHLRIRLGVFPQSTRRSHCHPLGGFPCPMRWTLQGDLGGGYLASHTVHNGSRPG